MLARRFWVPAAASLLPLACSSGGAADGAGAEHDGGVAGDAARIVPASLTVSALPGGNGVLELFALTLAEREGGAQLYAALRNEGDVPACDAALSVELYDREGQALAASITGLFTQRLHRLTDGSDTLAACAAPGDVTMAAITDLPSTLVPGDVANVVYRCPYFALDVVPVEGLAVEEVASVTRGEGTAYAGTLVNELDRAVNKPSITIFPVNRVGRPLGVATDRSTDELGPGGRWAFETSTVDAQGVDQVAYPAGAFAD
jgi:hypothetical protein